MRPDLVITARARTGAPEPKLLRAGAASRPAGRTLRETNLAETTGALLLAMRGSDGRFLTNPSLQTRIGADDVLIAIGTERAGGAAKRRRTA